MSTPTLSHGGLPSNLLDAEILAELKATDEALCMEGKGFLAADEVRQQPRIFGLARM